MAESTDQTGRFSKTRVAPRITVMVPTMGRPSFVIRLLRYYADLDFPHRVAIADSSEPEAARLITDAIEDISGRLDVTYHPCQGMNDRDALREIVLALDTPYAVFCADDDFQVPTALERCMDLLDREPRFVSAHGIGAMVLLDRAGAHGIPLRAGPYTALKPVEGETALDRLRTYLGDYSVLLFSVQRAEVWRAMYPDISLPDKSFESELLPCCLSAVKGPSAQIADLQVIRQVHEQRYLLPGMLDWLTSPEWHRSYEMFCSVLAERISSIDGISMETALEGVRAAFKGYLRQVCWKLMPSPGPGRFETALRRTSMWPLIKRLQYRLFARNALSLENFRVPGSRYFDDFEPVYCSLATEATSIPCGDDEGTEER